MPLHNSATVAASPDSTAVGTRRRYFAALGTIAVVSAVQFLILRSHTSDARLVSRTVDVAGRQAVLAERISFWAGQVMVSRSALARDEAVRYLRKDIEDLEVNETRLITGDPAITPQGWPPAGVRRLNDAPPFSTVERTALYVRHARAIATRHGNGNAADFLYLADHHDALVALYERIVKEYAVDSERQTARLLAEHAVAFGFVVLTLIGELVLIFLPMERMIRQRQERLHARATVDELTGLLNRSATYERLSEMLAAHAKHGEVAFFFIDIDNFKAVNDTLGHGGGDTLIVSLANRLRALTGEVGFAGRPGGDEFAILTHALRGRAQVEALAEKIRDGCRDPLTIDGRVYRPTVSVGVSRFPDDSRDLHTLLRQADTAMYAAKRAGRDTIRLYDPVMERDALHWRRLSAELAGAIAANQLALVYQPIVAAGDGRLLMVEALVRWRHPELGLLEPSAFIPIAEESGAIRLLDSWVIHAACRQMQKWRAGNVPVPRVAVNVSGRLFDGVELLPVLQEAIAVAGIGPGDIAIEVTEGSLVREFESTALSLRELRTLGIDVSIDDFGTGYSSLAYLKNLPADTLKIDRRFVSELAADQAGVAIVEAVIGLAHRLGLRTVAEGVEGAAQARLLREMGCDALQGYYIGRPVDAAQVADRLRVPVLESR